MSLESAEELCLLTLKIDAKFQGKLTCGLFIQSRKCIILKFTGELCVMAMKNDSKLEQKFTCQFKIDMRYLTNFDPSTQKSQKLEP